MHPFFYNAGLGIVSSDSIPLNKDNPLTIEHDVWIGANVVVTPGCRSIGLGAVIGAGAVVTKDVPRFAIAAGNPARVIGARFSPDIQEAIIKSRWWEHPVERLLPSLDLLLTDATPGNAQLLLERLSQFSSNVPQR